MRTFINSFLVDGAEQVAGVATSETRHECDEHDVRCQLDSLRHVELSQVGRSDVERIGQTGHVARRSVISDRDEEFL